MPPQVVTRLKELTSQNPDTVRTALLPSLSARLPHVALLLRGSRLSAEAATWHQAGNYANIRAVLSNRGRLRTYEVGFVRLNGLWRVIFMEPVS